MQPTDVLQSEHRVIERVLNCLGRIAASAAATGKLDVVSALQTLDFFRTFADRCHHGKEEQHLFPMLEARGFVRERGPTGVMLHEHEEGRGHIRAMTEAVENYQSGDAQALQRFVGHAQAYVQLLREHIAKEDRCLFPLANEVLTQGDRAALMKSFDHAEHNDMGLHTHEKYLRLADELADRFGVPRAELEPNGFASCCGSHSER
jgi:hemerythrin-like domain-containing protein